MSTPNAPVTVADPGGHYEEATHEGLTVSTNTATAEDIQKSLEFKEDDQGSAPPKELDTKPDGKAPAKTEVTSGPERGPDGRYLPKERKAEAGRQEEGRGAEGEQEGTQPEKPLGKPRDDPRARMLEATRESAALKRDMENLRRELQEARATPRPREAPATPPQEEGPPREEDYVARPYADYIAAVAEYKANERIKTTLQQITQQQRSQQYESQISGVMDGFKGKISSYYTEHPEQHDAALEVAAALTPSFFLPAGSTPGPSNVLADEVISSDHPEAFLSYFAEHPEHLQRFATLRTAREVWREVAKIEARIEDSREKAEAAASAGTAPRPVSKAQPPVRPVTGGTINADGELSDSMSDDAWLRAAQRKRLQR